ncbi:hypothetical protein AZL_d02820 (plasmid) [Azospirillum sp. B510]|uniref:hypothetical protein n=1 Tax=Azospirillum sp. (strain B510) TaxID=137722 RepID=UPI0001C4C808|nr:hypothetical protein [Azospirillum sp. B510]BAI76108.1 hypothetical protein AZL_d02820 [Azospirillum sp. B510]
MSTQESNNIIPHPIDPLAIPMVPVQIPLQGGTDGVFHMAIQIPGSNGVSSKNAVVQLDTGSTGLVLPAEFFYEEGTYSYNEQTKEITGTLMPGVKKHGHATVKYEPSTDDMHGFHFSVPNLLIGVVNNVGAAMTSEVTAIGIVEKTPHMCGIGFGRPVLASNPFLSVVGMSTGNLYPSFLLTTKGIWLGLTPEEAAKQLGGSFGYQKLTYEGPAPQPLNSSQWSTPTGYFRVSNINPTDTTKYGILVDTGVDLAMVKSPITDLEDQIKAGSIVAVEIPVEPASVTVAYSFAITGHTTVKLGPKAPESFVFTTKAMPDTVAPKYLVPRGTGNFVNTGFHLLNSYQLFFDAKVGQVGYAAYPA